jgi:hypothetical protein
MPSTFVLARQERIELIRSRFWRPTRAQRLPQVCGLVAGTYACWLDPRWALGGRLPNLDGFSFQHVTTPVRAW